MSHPSNKLALELKLQMGYFKYACIEYFTFIDKRISDTPQAQGRCKGTTLRYT